MGMDLLRRGAAARENLDRLQKNIDSLKGSIDSVRDANVSCADLSKRLTDGLSYEMQYSGAANDFNSFILHDRGGIVPPRSIDIGHLCFIFGLDNVRDLILERIKASPLKPGMPLAARPARIAELQRELRQAEVDAELEVLRLEKAGHTILRSVDADPAVLLELWGKAETEAENLTRSRTKS